MQHCSCAFRISDAPFGSPIVILLSHHESPIGSCIGLLNTDVSHSLCSALYGHGRCPLTQGPVWRSGVRGEDKGRDKGSGCGIWHTDISYTSSAAISAEIGGMNSSSSYWCAASTVKWYDSIYFPSTSSATRSAVFHDIKSHHLLHIVKHPRIHPSPSSTLFALLYRPFPRSTWGKSYQASPSRTPPAPSASQKPRTHPRARAQRKRPAISASRSKRPNPTSSSPSWMTTSRISTATTCRRSRCRWPTRTASRPNGPSRCTSRRTGRSPARPRLRRR